MNSKLFVILGVSISLGAGALTIGAVWDARQAALDQARVAAENLSHAVETGIARTFETYALSIEGARDALNNPQVKELPPELQRLAIFDRATEASNLGSVLVLDANGDVLADSKQVRPRANNLGDREYFKVQKEKDVGLYISAPFISRIDGAWSVALSRRIDREDGAFGGIIVGTIKLEYIRDLFLSLSAGSKGTVSLFRTDGVLLMRTPYIESELGRNFSKVGVFEQFKIRPSGTFDQVAVRDGVARRYVYGQIGRLPLLFSIGMAFDDILADWTRKAWAIAGFAALLYAAMLILAVMLAIEFRRRNSAERRALASTNRFMRLAEKASDAIVLRNVAGVRKYASPKFYEFLGRTPEEVGDQPLSHYLHPEHALVPAQSMQTLMRGGDRVSEQLHVLQPDGRSVWLEAISTGVRDESGRLREVITTMRDVTEQKLETDRMVAERDALEEAANMDPLTGVHNRRSFDIALAREVQNATRGGHALSVLMIDVDNFKIYNDRLGHPAGDAALKAVAQCLRSGARRPADFVARYGGEEFVVLLPNTDHDAAVHVAEEIRNIVVARNISHPTQSSVTISIGVSTSTDVENAGALLQAADRALYCAKAQGRNCVRAAEDMSCDQPHGNKSRSYAA